MGGQHLFLKFKVLGENQHWAGPPPIPGSTTAPHIHSDGDSADPLVHLTGTSLGCGRKAEDLEKAHADLGKHANSTQTVPAARNQFFSSSMLQENNTEKKNII